MIITEGVAGDVHSGEVSVYEESEIVVVFDTIVVEYEGVCEILSVLPHVGESQGYTSTVVLIQTVPLKHPVE